MVIRKNLRNLNAEDVDTLRNAFDNMYTDKQQRYQSYTSILLNYGHATQNDLDFLTWNRAFFHSFEQLLLEYAPGMGLPYWDYTEEESIRSGLPGFISEPVVCGDDNTIAPNPLYRGISSNKLVTYRETRKTTSPLLKEALDIANKAQDEKSYSGYLFQFYPVDVISHVWIGGSLTNLNAAPLDPLFWFSHCNLDRYWNIWQQKQEQLGKNTMPSTVLNAKLKPFTTTLKLDSCVSKLLKKDNKPALYLSGEDVLDIKDLGYAYDV